MAFRSALDFCFFSPPECSVDRRLDSDSWFAQYRAHDPAATSGTGSAPRVQDLQPRTHRLEQEQHGRESDERDRGPHHAGEGGSAGSETTTGRRTK